MDEWAYPAHLRPTRIGVNTAIDKPRRGYIKLDDRVIETHISREVVLPANYVLIDFENVQPTNLELLTDHPFKVLVFVGANQAKIPFELVTAMQNLGDKASYVKISGNGQNALDFHIAFYIGQLSAQEPKAYFHIISKDSGFDPLIKHLRSRKIRIQRGTDVREIPLIKASNENIQDEKINLIIKNLIGRGNSKPANVNTLSSTINSLFAKKLAQKELTALLQELQGRKLIVVNKEKVSYRIPSSVK